MAGTGAQRATPDAASDAVLKIAQPTRVLLAALAKEKRQRGWFPIILCRWLAFWRYFTGRAVTELQSLCPDPAHSNGKE
jgi:hypothetical protein